MKTIRFFDWDKLKWTQTLQPKFPKLSEILYKYGYGWTNTAIDWHKNKTEYSVSHFGVLILRFLNSDNINALSVNIDVELPHTAWELSKFCSVITYEYLLPLFKDCLVVNGEYIEPWMIKKGDKWVENPLYNIQRKRAYQFAADMICDAYSTAIEYSGDFNVITMNIY